MNKLTIELELRGYCRIELEEIFQTSRTDSIKRSLKREGYTFESSGRGKGYRITITALLDPPTPFEEFARREFDCGSRTNFKEMETHFFLLFYHPDYQFLPSNHQAKYLEENYGITVSDQSLRNWQKKLINLNWIAKDAEKVRYCLCKKGEPPREITAEQYKKAWNKYFSMIGNGMDRSNALHIIFEENEGMPRKQVGFTENALEQGKLHELRNILENII